MSLQVVLTQVAAVRSLNSMDPGIFSNLIFAILFRKITATEQKFPSVSTAKGTTTEDGDLPFSHALSWQRLYLCGFYIYVIYI